MSSNPLPSTLIALSDLHKRRFGDKVRFLGCVTKYNVESGEVTVKHDHPPGNHNQVIVDVKLLLESLKSTDTSVGEWVNIIGYITRQSYKTPLTSNGSKFFITSIQAIVLWSAGSIKLQEYEKALSDQDTVLNS